MGNKGFIAPGTTVYDGGRNQFLVGESIGLGGCGLVFKITATADQEIYALKTLPTGFSGEESIATLMNEANAAMGIKHDNVIDYLFVHEGNRFPDLPPYIIMHFAQGGSLAEMIRLRATESLLLKQEEVQDYCLQLVAGMAAISGAGLIHRDLKPLNVLLDNGTLKITDFGLAKVAEEATRARTFKGWGTSPYIAPEVWRGETATIQTDMYSLGIMMYEVATLQLPIRAANDSPIEWQRAHSTQVPEPPSSLNSGLSSAFDRIVAQLLAKRPSDRHRDWHVLDQEIASIGNSQTVRPAEVQELLSALSDKDKARQEAEQARMEKELVREEYRTQVQSKFRSEIEEPINSFVKQFNEHTSGPKLSYGVQWDEDTCRSSVSLGSEASVAMSLVVLHPDTHVVIRRVRDVFDRGVHEVQEYCLPKFRDTDVQVLGTIIASDQKGVNVLLLSGGEHSPSKWVILENRNSAGIRREPRLPEPFAFDLHELEREMQSVDAMHIYSTVVRDFDVNLIGQMLTAAVKGD